MNNLLIRRHRFIIHPESNINDLEQQPEKAKGYTMSLKKITGQSIMLAYFQNGGGRNGLQAIRDIHSYSKSMGRDGIARKTLLDAQAGLKLDGESSNAFTEMVLELIGEPGDGQRGRSAPVKGESRDFKVQVVKDGLPFIRLPVNVLEAMKGESVTVLFEEGQLTVTY